MDKILLSTDIGSDIDDALALLVMLNHPEINLRGIYTVNGDVDSRSFIARHMVKLAKKNIPVGQGTSLSVGAEVPPYSHGEKYLVDWSYIDEKRMNEENPREVIFISPEKEGIIPNGVEHLARRLEKEKQVVFSIAPLTDIALLLRDYPRAAQNIEKLYFMGCRLPAEETMEHNIRYDALAAQQVLSSDIPITIIPGDVCDQYQMPTALAENMKQSPVGKYVARMLDAFVGAELALAFGRRIINNEGLPKILRDTVKICPEKNAGLSAEEVYQLHQSKERILENLDVEAAYCDPKDFWKSYQTLIAQLRNPRYGYTIGEIMARELESLIPRDVSIADVYVPYCYLHPDKLRTERMTLTSDNHGKTIVYPGDKLEVVRDLDWTHFQQFLQEWIK